MKMTIEGSGSSYPICCTSHEYSAEALVCWKVSAQCREMFSDLLRSVMSDQTKNTQYLLCDLVDVVCV